MKDASKHIPYLDGWRGIAILAVFFGHFYPDRRYWFVGTFGVNFFFVLSGYLMCNILFIRGTKLPDFFVRRLIRVYPTFSLFVVSLALYTSLVQVPDYVPSFSELLSTLAFLRTYYPANIFNAEFPIGHLWSLNVEEHSYIFLAVIATIGHKAQKKWLTALALIVATLCALITSQLYFASQPDWASPSDVRTEAAALGILASVTICYLRHLAPTYFEKLPRLTPIVAVALAFACFYFYRYRGLQLTAAPLFMALAVNLIDRAPAFVRQALSNRVFQWLGTCSFSLYLWQQPFHVAFREHGASNLLTVTGAIALGLASFYAFEQPVRAALTSAWKNRHARRPVFIAQDVDQHPIPKLD